MAGASESVLPFPIPEGPPSTRPSSFPFPPPAIREPETERGSSRGSLNALARDISARVPYPVLFIAGAALGILVASIIVILSNRGHAAASAQLLAPAPASTWAPLPVVTITPAPPAPVEAMPIAALPAAPAPVMSLPAARPAKTFAARPHARRGSANLLASAL